MVLTEIQTLAIEAIMEACHAVMEIYRNPITWEEKSDGSPVTQADLASSSIIQGKLKQTSIPIIEEESPHETYQKRALWTQCWCVDPLDGTKEFIKKNDEFSINIALLSAGVPLFGVIAIPVQSKLVFGGPDIGAYVATFDNQSTLSDPIRIIPKPNQQKTFTIITSRSHRSEKTDVYLSAITPPNVPTKTLYRGSAIKFVDLALGLAQIYIRDTPTMEWDVAAGQAILRGVGGNVVDIDRKKALVFNKKSLLNPGFIATTNLSLLGWQIGEF